MALFIGNSLARGGILDLSEAQAAFSPWWDQLQVSAWTVMLFRIIYKVCHFPAAACLTKGLCDLYHHTDWIVCHTHG